MWSAYVYIQELEKKTQFVNGHKKVRSYLKLRNIINILVPSLVRDKRSQRSKAFIEDEGEITLVVIECHQFENLVRQYTGTELLHYLDNLYNAFDQLCDQFGLSKIEAVGKCYFACGGLKSAEKKIDQRLLNRHHSVRVTDFAMEALNYVRSLFIKSGK